MKNVFILLLLGVTSLNTPTANPTLITLKWKSSEILSDSEGKNPINVKLQHHYIEQLNYEIRQLDEDSFEILGSPIEWEGRNVK